MPHTNFSTNTGHEQKYKHKHENLAPCILSKSRHKHLLFSTLSYRVIHH
nr:MAG TPA: hypothetical protein [Caudoviricetes sp.]